MVVIFGGWTVKLIGQNQKQKQTIQSLEAKEQQQNEQLNKLLEEQRVLKEQKQKLEKENATLKQAKTIKATRVASVKTYSGSCYAAMKTVWPQPLWGQASAIIKAESGGNPKAVSRTNDHGCFQMNRGYQSWGRAVYDPTFNAKVAYRMYCARGWRPWTTARKLGLR